ncbi:MAG: DUF4231 domain-containing protein [Deltaproteobacteria bacterium]|nr:DUF4231 domain-containing protein [Deltaproteobacteria bacterium]
MESTTSVDNNYLIAFEETYRRYRRASSTCKVLHYFFQTMHLLLATSVPIILLLDHDDANLIGAIISFAATFSLCLTRLFRFQENWFLNKRVAEELLREKNLFQGHAGPYRKLENGYEFFIETVERITKLESNDWIRINAGSADSTSDTAATKAAA